MKKEASSCKSAVDLGLEILSISRQNIQRNVFKKRIIESLMTFFDTDTLEIMIKNDEYFYVWRGYRDTGGEISILKISGEDELEEIINAWKPEELLHSSAIGRCKISEKEGARTVTVPFDIEGDGQGGVLAVHYTERPYEKISEIAETVGSLLGIAISYRNTHWNLRERIKELTCLFQIAKLIHKPPYELDSILSQIIAIIPKAFQFEDVATARICLEGACYDAGGGGEPVHVLQSDIYVEGKPLGLLEVGYKESIGQELGEEPFLIEEQKLLDSIAEQLSLIIEDLKREEDKKKLEDQLRHADRLATIGQLSAGVAHELNEPLGSILGFAELIKKSDPCGTGSGETDKDVDKIIGAAKHAREIVKQLLIFGRQVKTTVTEVDVNAVVRQAVGFFEGRCRKEGIDLQVDLAQDIPEIWIDPSHLNQIIINLSVNAIQAMPSGGMLGITTRRDEKDVHIEVRDTGCGIEAELEEKIFLPFFTTKDIGEGTGLGLAVVHGLVSSYDGSVSFTSREGRGTEFHISLPLARMRGT
jgi:signal transduction histidine kinase